VPAQASMCMMRCCNMILFETLRCETVKGLGWRI
jgi:hypothetical protein